MSMILELTKDYVVQEYFDKGLLHGPTVLQQGLRGLLSSAGHVAGYNGITEGADIAVIKVVNEDAVFELVAVPLTHLKIVCDNNRNSLQDDSPTCGFRNVFNLR